MQSVVNSNYISMHLQSQLLKSNALDLNRDTLRQLSNSHTAASRLMSEELLIGSIHLGEVGHISQEDLQKTPHISFCHDIISRNPRETVYVSR